MGLLKLTCFTVLLQLKSVLVDLLCRLKPPSLSSFANCNNKQTQTLPTAPNQAATTGMLTVPGLGLRALAAHSSGTDNGKFYLEVFVAAVLCVSLDSKLHLAAFNPADWRRSLVRHCLPAFVIH